MGLLQVLDGVARTYVEVESARSSGDAVVVPSGGTTIIGDGSVLTTSTPAVIEIRIEGGFTGWAGKAVFKLANGQIWQQISFAYMYHYAYSPKVLNCRSGSGYRMRVGALSTEIEVRRLK